MKKIFAILLSLPLIASCAAAGSAAVGTGDLAANAYVLTHVNGEAFAHRERMPEIEFDATMRVAGQVCNRFMGQGTLKDGVLTVPQMASTMMLCADGKLNEMEREFSDMLRQGAEVTLSGDTLTLRKGETEYVYTKKSR